MLVAAIISVSVVSVVVVVLFIRARSLPRKRRRQSETAARLFDDGAIAELSNHNGDKWSDEQREAALLYYNTAGRRARIGGIRVDLIPDNHRSHIQRLTESMANDNASQTKWSDFLWLAARVEKRRSTSRSAAAPSGSEPSVGSDLPSVDRAENLATALGLNGSAIDMDEMEQAAERPAVPPSSDSSTADIEGTAESDLSSQITPNVEHSQSDDAPTDPNDPAADSHDPAQDNRDPAADSHDPAQDNQDPERSQLPDVPAWILEARAALPKSHSAAGTDAVATNNNDPADPKPMLAGTDFSWPRAASPDQQAAPPDDVPEPVDFLPDLDGDELATVLEDTPDPHTSPADAGTEQDTELADSRSDDEEIAAKLDEIRRLKRKAKKARRQSEESSRRTVKYAREGRRKKARVAANAAFDQADLAKRLKQRARRLERSLRN